MNRGTCLEVLTLKQQFVRQSFVPRIIQSVAPKTRAKVLLDNEVHHQHLEGTAWKCPIYVVFMTEQTAHSSIGLLRTTRNMEAYQWEEESQESSLL